MFIQKKIEEIRQKPEHIRLRYVYFFVAIFMIFFFLIWLFSLPEEKSHEEKQIIPEKLLNQKDELLKSAKKSQEALEEAKKSMEGFTPERPQE